MYHFVYHRQNNSTDKNNRVMKKLIGRYYNRFPDNYGLIVVRSIMVTYKLNLMDDVRDVMSFLQLPQHPGNT